MTHFDFLLRIGVRIGVRIARVVLRKKVLTPSSCRRRIATQMLPRKCCHANVATQMLPRKCCHANVATQMLPRKCCHATCCQAVLNVAHAIVATQMLPRNFHANVATQLLPRKCCHAIVATQLLPPAPVVSSSCHRPPALSSPSGSHHQCRSSSLPTSILTGVLAVLTHPWAVR